MRSAAAICCAAFLGGVPVTGAAAQETQVSARDGLAQVAMPCAEADVHPFTEFGGEGSMCVRDDVMFILTVAGNEAGSDNFAFTGDFSSVSEQIRTSPETSAFTESEQDGHRMLDAQQGPDPKFGLVRAIEINGDQVAYAVVLSAYNRGEAASDQLKALSRSFVESLAVAR